MSSIHRIRLRGPWDCLEPGDRRRIKLPASWRDAFPEPVAGVTLTRSFGCPDGIEAGDRLWIEVSPSRDTLVALNGHQLGSLARGTGRFDVTSILETRNELRLTVDEPGTEDRDETILEAALLIEAAR